MTIITTLPDELSAVLGPEATAKLVDVLNESFSLHKEDVIAVSGMQFENRLVRETSAIRIDVAELRSETREKIAELRSETREQIAELRAETREQIAGLRAETRAEIAGVRNEIAGLRAEVKADLATVQREIAGVHREIANQTRWILAAAAAIITMYPLMSRLLVRLIP